MDKNIISLLEEGKRRRKKPINLTQEERAKFDKLNYKNLYNRLNILYPGNAIIMECIFSDENTVLFRDGDRLTTINIDDLAKSWNLYDK